MNPIFDLFAASPMRPMQNHMQKVLECVAELSTFFEAALAQNWESVEIKQKRIRALENEANEQKKTLRLHLPKGLFMPVSRIDLLALLSTQDKIADKAKDIAGLITGRRMTFPDSIQADLVAFVDRSIDAAKQASKAVEQLDELLETGFRGREVVIVEEMVHELDIIENDVDVLQIKLRRKLFLLEETLPAVQIMFMYKTLEWIGDLSDRSQQVGSRLELLLAR